MNHPDSFSINPAAVNWSLVESSTMQIHQRFSYRYPARIRNLQHRLVVFPPDLFGNQRLTLRKFNASRPGEVFNLTDHFENSVVEFRSPAIESEIEFEAWVEVERSGAATPRTLPASWLTDQRLLTPTTRTMPGKELEAAASDLERTGLKGLELAEAANLWVYHALSYAKGVTDVQTTAEQALSGGAGVCQDYAHILIVICRLLGIPSLYVSGHMLGEGGTHAWIEALLPASDGSDNAEAWALDPTHGRRVGPTYLPVAVGRDYGDVAPTSGSYIAPFRGELSTSKSVRLTEVAYRE